MPKKRATWAASDGRYGETVRIYEPARGAALRFDYREGKRRLRPIVEPKLHVRKSPTAALDLVLEKQAKEALRAKVDELHLVEIRKASEPEQLTVGDAYRLLFAPGRRSLPKSASAKKHHTTSRAFWQQELGLDTPWDAIKPADVRGALIRLIETGMIASAEKRFHNLRRLHRWLRDDMAYETLRDPTRGIKIEQLTEGYEPRRPRYSPGEATKMVATAIRIGTPRERLFTVVNFDAGSRGGQTRLAMRSGFNRALDPAPPAGMAPHGWLFLPGVKRQKPRLIFLTERSRAAVDAAIAAYPPEWEQAWLERGEDYPLVPGGDYPFGLVKEPETDAALRKWWPKLEKAAGVPTMPRRSFHGARRRWADSTNAAIGTDKTAHAGGWEKRDTLEDVYLSQYRYEDLEAARVANEEGT